MSKISPVFNNPSEQWTVFKKPWALTITGNAQVFLTWLQHLKAEKVIWTENRYIYQIRYYALTFTSKGHQSKKKIDWYPRDAILHQWGHTPSKEEMDEIKLRYRQHEGYYKKYGRCEDSSLLI